MKKERWMMKGARRGEWMYERSVRKGKKKSDDGVNWVLARWRMGKDGTSLRGGDGKDR